VTIDGVVIHDWDKALVELFKAGVRADIAHSACDQNICHIATFPETRCAVALRLKLSGLN